MLCGRLWGAVIVSSVRPGTFAPGDEDRISSFAELVAQALANAEARELLAASRRRIVQAGDEERRRLERNLHDGAQQRLVALALTVRMVERKLESDPETACRMLAHAGTELDQALAELREIARGLHPAVLTDRGLGPALDALATRAPIPVDVAGAIDARLPAPVEAAAYYVVAEALTNVAKYAQASEARIDVRRDDGRLVVEVADDGVGGADASRGSGLRGLADRVEALGGRLEVSSPEGEGTTLRATLPCLRVTRAGSASHRCRCAAGGGVGSSGRRPSSSRTACRSRSRASRPGAGGARGSRPRAALTYQVVAALSTTPGRGSGRTTGRMWLWRPVRFRADMVWSPPVVVRSV